MRKTPAVLLWALPVVTGLVAIAIWYGVRAASGLQSWILPTPLEIVEAAWRERGRLLAAVGSTAVGALLGFLLAGASGFAMSLVLGGGDGQWCGAVMAGVGVGGAEALDSGGFADEFGGAQWPAAWDCKQRGREERDVRGDLIGERFDLERQCPVAFDVFAGEPGDEPLMLLEAGR